MFSLVKIDMEKQLVILQEEYEVSVCVCDALRVTRLKVVALFTSLLCVCVSEYLSGWTQRRTSRASATISLPGSCS